MLSVELSNSAKKFLKHIHPPLAKRLVDRVEKLAQDPFPKDVKRVVNRKEKIFRVRVGSYRIQYSVFFDRNLLFISDIDKRERAY
mgnify:CR=1 FL=1|tara:strand:+ start:796 stop:1050 length:255 start_codon:yes stop_codon:yes gene_type:complete